MTGARTVDAPASLVEGGRDARWHASARGDGRVKLNVRTKLLGGFLAVVALMVVVGVVAISKIGSIHDVTTAYGEDTVPSVQAAGRAEAAINRVRKDQLRYVSDAAITGDVRASDSAGEAIEEGQAQVAAALADARRLARGDAGDIRPVQQLQDAWQRYLDAAAPYRPLTAQGRYAEALRALSVGPADVAYDEVKEGIAALSKRQSAVSGL
jgi:methyl-accepting chemotaxis protein